MVWETPSFVEIEMNAEIGSYQEDFESEDSPRPVFAEPAGASAVAVSEARQG